MRPDSRQRERESERVSKAPPRNRNLIAAWLARSVHSFSAQAVRSLPSRPWLQVRGTGRGKHGERGPRKEPQAGAGRSGGRGAGAAARRKQGREGAGVSSGERAGSARHGRADTQHWMEPGAARAVWTQVSPTRAGRAHHPAHAALLRKARKRVGAAAPTCTGPRAPRSRAVHAQPGIAARGIALPVLLHPLDGFIFVELLFKFVFL